MNFLFDLYGTLLDIWTDEEKASLWENCAILLGEGADAGAKIKREYKDICKRYYEAREHKFFEFDLLCVFEEMLENHGIDKAKAPEFARKFRLYSRERITLFPYVIEMLKGLKGRGAGVYLVSNAQSCFTLDELDEVGLTPLFDGILISSDAGVKKPCGEIFDIAFDKFSISASDSYYVGNDLHDDVLGAHGAGLKTVYIETEQSGKYQSEILVVPDHTVVTHREMMTLLFSLIE